ncbi:hypothetical protein CONLIGDRAFT_716169 [Coniochaeta ligniaria NRRL 30616]|uniref:Uncharacterized protein n=1 Tax=Coniochaeta ligniaria NRRL 30616 TaxID=1408157 RepID=A0A1J7J381_9PEZI|nr:hypothetical protein CONLIGDRAFT_716169 [Coniochaeta ligniaria NRRL 30616]
MLQFRPGSFNAWTEELSDEQLRRLPSSVVEWYRPMVLRLDLHDGEKAALACASMPFDGATAEIDNYVNAGAKINGFRSLRDILRQDEFNILVRPQSDGMTESLNFGGFYAQHERSKPVYPYGRDHHWNMPWYERVIPRNLIPTYHPVKPRFDDANDAMTTLTQTVVHPAFWFAREVNVLRSMTLKFQFVKEGDMPVEETQLLHAIFDITMPHQRFPHANNIFKTGSTLRLGFPLPSESVNQNVYMTYPKDLAYFEGYVVQDDLREEHWILVVLVRRPAMYSPGRQIWDQKIKQFAPRKNGRGE